MANKSDEQMKQQTVDAVDTVGNAIKEASKKLFDACVERTTEIFSNAFDQVTEKTKEKITEKGTKDDRETDKEFKRNC